MCLQLRWLIVASLILIGAKTWANADLIRNLTLPDGKPMPVSIAVVDKFSYIVADYWDLTPKFDSCSQPIDLKEEKRGTTSATFFCIFNKINDLHAQTVELEVPYINRLLP